MEDAGTFYDRLLNMPANWYIVWLFIIFCGNLAFFHVLVYCTTKNLATLSESMNPSQWIVLSSSG
jgi:hypothetical protein